MKPRDHLLARSRLAQLADTAMAKSWRGPNRKPPLEPDFIWVKGSKGFGEADETSCRSPEEIADFRKRLDRLCASLNEEAELNALGHAMAYGQLKSAVRNRHALGALWNKEPDLAKTEIAPPIIVVGQMRSGTTRVHRLLAADPRHAGTRFCDSLDPVPRSPDTRPFKGALTLAIARQINPWIDLQHPFGPTRADEEIGWLSAALSPVAFEAQWHIPSFVEFSETGDVAPIYREMDRVLRTDAARKGNAALPRVLKCPQYSEDLATLLSQFPDARLVVTRREAKPVLSSAISVIASQRACQSDTACLDAITAEWQRKIALRDARMEAALARFDGPLAEVDFADLEADWEGVMAATYCALGLEFDAAALSAMQAEQARAKASRHKHHREQIISFESA